METPAWLSCHNFFSTENITLVFVSSDDFLHASFLEVAEQQMWS